MNYPLISEYIEAIKSAEDNFEELSYLRPVLGDDGLPVMTSGGFAVVFKMKDERDGKLYAVKCFTKEQEGRAEAYRHITEELKDVDSPYLTSVRYLDKELFVDTKQTNETEFPVLLMDWIEGKTLDNYLRENLDDKYALEKLAYRFRKLAQWLIPQPFAHGDLKPDNILVRENGTLVLVDYDGMYVPAMKGQKARELGSPDFRHPLRTENDFDEHIDDFTLVTIVFSLKLITVLLKIQDKQISFNLPIISAGNYQDVEKCILLEKIDSVSDDETKKLCKIFLKSCKTYNQTTIGTEFLGIYKMQSYPLISEYIEAIKSAEDNFEELSYLRPVLGDDGLPVMTSGGFAVVFKMKDERDGKLYAVKCFTKEQEGRAEAYRHITEELKDVDSPYLTSVRYLDKELFVDTKQTNETEFPVLLMDWIEGKTLDNYLRENLDDKYALEKLAYRFRKLAQWLIPQPFAHGDLKPDNILVRENGTLVLVDYDGMYVPAMKGQKARELGSPDFRHPLRTENDFDEHIDDFTLVTIVFSLKLITVLLKIQDKQISFNLPIISAGNYQDVEKCILLEKIDSVSDYETKELCKIFLKSCKTYNQTTIGTEFLGIYKMQRFVIFILLLLTFIILYFIYFIIKLFLQSDVVLPLTWSFIYLITILIGSLFAYSGKELGCTKPGCGCFLLCIFMFLGAKLATWIVNCLFEL